MKILAEMLQFMVKTTFFSSENRYWQYRYLAIYISICLDVYDKNMAINTAIKLW